MLSLEFSRPEYWNGQCFPSPGDLPNPGIEPRSPALQEDSLPTDLSGKPKYICKALWIQRGIKLCLPLEDLLNEWAREAGGCHSDKVKYQGKTKAGPLTLLTGRHIRANDISTGDKGTGLNFPGEGYREGHLWPRNSMCRGREIWKRLVGGFPGGPVVRNLPCNAGDTGFIPGWGTKIPRATERLSSCATTTEPVYSRVRVLRLQKPAQPGACSPEPESLCPNDEILRNTTKIPRAASKTRCSQIN